jgi:hypothetical protein
MRDSAGLVFLAERRGFEPPVEVSPYDGLANRCFRPLSHLSARGNRFNSAGFGHCQNTTRGSSEEAPDRVTDVPRERFAALSWYATTPFMQGRAAPGNGCSGAGLAHQPVIPPTIAASKVTPSGTETRSMMSSNGPRAAVPSSLPFMGATTARKAATATASSSLRGWIVIRSRFRVRRDDRVDCHSPRISLAARPAIHVSRCILRSRDDPRHNGCVGHAQTVGPCMRRCGSTTARSSTPILHVRTA